MNPEKKAILNVEVGDLLEIKRTVYKHWAVYIGKNKYMYDFWTNSFSILVHPPFTTPNSG